jgi:hypothetical protein
MDRSDARFGYLSYGCPALAAEAVARALWKYRHPTDSAAFVFWRYRLGAIDGGVFESALAILTDSGSPPVAEWTRLAAWDLADWSVQLSRNSRILSRRVSPVDSTGRCLAEGAGETLSRVASHGPSVVRPLAPDAAVRLRAAVRAVAARPETSVRLRHGMDVC